MHAVLKAPSKVLPPARNIRAKKRETGRFSASHRLKRFAAFEHFGRVVNLVVASLQLQHPLAGNSYPVEP